MNTHKIYRNGNTSIKLRYSPVNQAWLVWREDGSQSLGHTLTIGLSMFETGVEAYSDFESRVSFHKQVIGA